MEINVSELRARLCRTLAAGHSVSDAGSDRGDHCGTDSGNGGECRTSTRLSASGPGHCHEHGAVLIADEMQTGFGRTGLMWGCDHDGVVPDLMTVGKGIAGGFPLSALISTDELTSRKPFANPSGSSSSYGGNPLAAAAGLATLEIILKDDLVKHAERVGSVMMARLRAMQERHRCIGDVRGRGLILGLEL